MERKDFVALDRVVQDQLASKYGVTRSGLDNLTVTEAELSKIPVEGKKIIKETPKEDEKVEKKTSKRTTKKAFKRSNKRGATK